MGQKQQKHSMDEKKRGAHLGEKRHTKRTQTQKVINFLSLDDREEANSLRFVVG